MTDHVYFILTSDYTALNIETQTPIHWVKLDDEKLDQEWTGV